MFHFRRRGRLVDMYLSADSFDLGIFFGAKLFLSYSDGSVIEPEPLENVLEFLVVPKDNRINAYPEGRVLLGTENSFQNEQYSIFLKRNIFAEP